jgi:hypothetical protein
MNDGWCFALNFAECKVDKVARGGHHHDLFKVVLSRCARHFEELSIEFCRYLCRFKGFSVCGQKNVSCWRIRGKRTVKCDDEGSENVGIVLRMRLKVTFPRVMEMEAVGLRKGHGSVHEDIQ